jgi:hypothetical protein
LTHLHRRHYEAIQFFVDPAIPEFSRRIASVTPRSLSRETTGKRPTEGLSALGPSAFVVNSGLEIIFNGIFEAHIFREDRLKSRFLLGKCRNAAAFTIPRLSAPRRHRLLMEEGFIWKVVG